MDGIASVYQRPDTISRQAVIYLQTIGWSLNHTRLVVVKIPEQCAMSEEYWVLTSARATAFNPTGECIDGRQLERDALGRKMPSKTQPSTESLAFNFEFPINSVSRSLCW